ncbi:hypothetical protein [Arenimonas composti]|nr:hypothetical protein [Arenimonas composti]
MKLLLSALPLLLGLAAMTASAQEGGAPATSPDAPRVPSAEIRAEIDRLRSSNQLLERKNSELTAEIARVRARIAELDPDGELVADTCARQGTGCALANGGNPAAGAVDD